MEMQKPRCAGFDVLKIISMFLIVCFHCAYKGEFNITDNFANQIILDIMFYFGLLGVNCFALITGYFYESMFFKKKKFVKMLLQIMFYTGLGVIILTSTGHDMNIATVLYRLMPFDVSIYWYGVAYLMLLLIAPYLNILIQSMSSKQHKKLIAICVCLFSLVPTIKTMFWQNDFMERTGFYNRFIWLIVMYMIGAYIFKYGFPIIINKKKAIELFVLSSFALMSFVLMTNMFDSGLSTVFFSPNSPFELLLSISLFGVFYYSDVKSNYLVSTVSKLTFGVYLFHDGLLDDWIWNNGFQINQYQNEWYMVLSILTVSIIVFVTGLLIELLRQKIERLIETKIVKSS